ncbi:hypothetical protein DFH11DRAFT_1634500 [Phellopilus nigrolimitatus]|nr:hypothetical protein DFH11DRAFT_1634500 [Phellopilus nigrolimitatus]
MSMSSEDAVKAEIARLTGAINRHKTGPPSNNTSYFGRNSTYVNPDYKPTSKASLQSNQAFQRPAASSATRLPPPSVGQPREVVIDGVAFQSSGRSLVRKDLAKAPSAPKPPFKPVQPRQDYARTYPGTRATQRPYKAKSARRFPQNHNMTLANGRKPVRMGRKAVKSMKYFDKQCSRFSVTGVCSRGRTCPCKHDPSKIAICWPFLQGSCPNTAETCSLSHDPTPERTPLCVHFANNGRCKNGDDCLFPHVHVGPRIGVCRDFAVLGFCEKGIDCDHQHVRECPDFAEKGTCPNPKCKLPHVIRANQRRAGMSSTMATGKVARPSIVANATPSEQSTSDTELQGPRGDLSGNDTQIGDEYISLTFHESEESEEEDDDDNDDDNDDDKEAEEDGDDEDSEEDDGPNDANDVDANL